MDSGPRDLRRSDPIRRPPSCHVACKVRTVWEHSPTWKKERGRTRLNRGEDSPINYHNISSLLRDTWRPTRAPTWPRGLPAIWRAPCTSCVGHTRPATWPQCHVVTARWSRAPRQPPPGFACHVIIRYLWTKIPPFFAILTKKFI